MQLARYFILPRNKFHIIEDILIFSWKCFAYFSKRLNFLVKERPLFDFFIMNSLVSIHRDSFAMKFALSKKTFQLEKFAYREQFSADLHLSVESAAKFLLEWILCWICEEIRSIHCVAWPLPFYDFFLTFGSKISSCESACPYSQFRDDALYAFELYFTIHSFQLLG